MKYRNLHHFSAIALFLMSFSQFSLAQNGCIDPLACNFDPNAVVDDGTCSYTIDCAGICGGENVLDFCGNCYNPNGPSEPVLFAYTGNLQQWIIPDGVTTVTIEAWGAQGGNAPGNVRTGGLGAYMKGDFAVIPGQVLNVVVGGQGLTKPNDGGTNYGGGGGGGSFIWISPNTPLLIAGGGGGAHDSANGGSGLTGSSGGNSNNGAAGGSNGNGGGGGGTCAGAGGGGWVSAGANASCFNYATLFGGGSFDSFLAGLCGAPCNAGGANYGTSGGYGGGAAGWHGGGGGGGYSGGGGGGNSVGNGGGGGSYNAGDNQAATAGINSGNGSVLISFSGIPECLAGCTDPLACNYDPSAELEDGSCAYPDGCADPSACNYDPAAQCDNGTCTYPGCNDPAACNFDAQAGCDNGSCAYVLDCAGVCGGNFVQDACGNCYDPNAANDNLTFAYTGNLQQWTVPDGVTSLTIEAWGAQGGNAPGNVRTGGLGAYIKGDFTVVPGQVLNIVVGGQGLTKPNDGGTNYGGGGGGGSFIWISPNIPLLIAGGGGGAHDSANGGSGLTGSSGGNSNNGAAGGSNGNGGGGGGTCAGAGGGGWLSAGTNAGCFNYATLFGGGSFDSFLAGLCGAPCSAGGANYGTSGGYGGGAAGWHGGGGGGGYSGGGGGGNSVGNGGGGGSYNAGINQVAEAGVNSGNGLVIISFAGLPDCIPGCTDPLADNYNPEANFDDGSCAIQGCTNPLALNYNPLATNDDGSCVVPGCTYADAINYNPDANTDDGSCQFDSCPQVSGCTDHLACNFTPGANADDGSCDYTCYGCTYADSPNYDPSATIDDGSCDFSCNEDLNGDGLINTSDLLNLLAVFGNACE